MKTRYLLAAFMLLAIAVVEYSVVARIDVKRLVGGRLAAQYGASSGPAPTASAGPPPAYDIRGLLQSPSKFLGVAINGSPPKMDGIDAFAAEVGKRPNLITIYESFADGFAANEVRQVYDYGGLAAIRWEPVKAQLADIAAGKHDPYIKTFAASVRKTNLPIMLTFGHEMNGDWYSWGRQNKPSNFVAAWRHVHDVFAQVGATNVIWTWTPNVINPMPGVKLQPLYPGDAYVDWVGIDGYYTYNGQQTFRTLFGPTMTQVRTFTKKPFLIVETAAEPGMDRPTEIIDLFTAVAADPEVLGFVWFNNNGSGKWNIDRDPAAVKAFRDQAKSAKFGFTVK